jgi:predicted naringenin-chalcone synthase
MRVCGVGSAFQKNYSSRNVIREALKNQWPDKLERPQILDHLHSNVGVQGRHLTLPIAAYEGLLIWGKANNASIPGRFGTRRVALGGFCSELVLREW